MDHSLKNLMIRAVKKQVSEGQKMKAMNQIKEISKEFSADNALVRLLIQDGILPNFIA